MVATLAFSIYKLSLAFGGPFAAPLSESFKTSRLHQPTRLRPVHSRRWFRTKYDNTRGHSLLRWFICCAQLEYG